MKKMRKLKFSLGFLLIALFVSSATLFSQEARKEIAKSYTISDGYSLGIENKYGNIEIVNWEKDELQVKVVIEASSKNQEKAEKLVKSVEIDIDELSNGVNFKTIFPKSDLDKKERIKITYSVQTPVYLNVDLTQKYGEIFIQKIYGHADINVQYGTLDAGELINKKQKSPNSLSVSYGDATIEKTTQLNSKAQYSECMIGQADAIEVESAYSKINVDEFNELNANSKYDKYKLGKLMGSFIVNANYTNVNIKYIDPGFELIRAEMTYGNLVGNLDAKTSFNIDARAAYGEISIPGGDVKEDKDSKKQSVSGTVGKSASAKIEADLTYGNLKLESE